MEFRLPAALTACLLAAPVMAQLRPANAPIESRHNMRTYIFKSTPQDDLTIDVYLPPGWKIGQKHPAIVLEHGSGGDKKQFRTKAEYLASRGMVAMVGEYGRTARTKDASSINPVEDCKSTIRWVRMNAKALGIDPNRVVGAGGSAGAACMARAAFTGQLEPPQGEDPSVSSKPNILVLYNPALRLPGTRAAPSRKGSEMSGVADTWKVEKGDPPMIFFFGTDDNLLPASLEIARQSAALGNRTEFYTAAGQKHGFFNEPTSQYFNEPNGGPRRVEIGSAGWHDVVLYQTDLFLSSLGCLRGKPTVHPDPKLVLKRVELGETKP
jgi:acetyl esterase